MQEVAVMAKLDHPSLLPLLASAAVPGSQGGIPQTIVYLLFPLYAVRPASPPAAPAA